MAAVTLAAATTLGAGPVAAAPAAQGHSREDDLLLFQLRLGSVVLDEAFPGFPAGTAMRLPLGQLCQALVLAVEVDPGRGRAEGFLVTERRRFLLDLAAGTCTVGEVSHAFPRDQVEVHPDDLYLDTRLLTQWLPLDLDVAAHAAVVTVTPRELLPLQEKWQRESNAGRIAQDQAPVAFEPVPDPYRLGEFPAVDLTLGGTAASRAAGSRPFSGQGTLLATGDLLGLSGSGYLAATAPAGATRGHGTLSRQDPRGGLLGPLRATAYAVGNVLDPGLSLVAAPTSGNGVLLTNQTVASSTFDRHAFQGDLPPGWQVELYRNQALIGFQASRPDGHYQFLNVPLYFGWNEFRLVFYGPQGQRREERQGFDVSTSLIPAGQLHYQALALRPDGQAGQRQQFQLDFGLARQASATLASTRLFLDGAYHAYTEAAVQGFWKPLAGGVTLGRDDRGGAVAELALRKRLGPLSLVGKRAELRNGFTSELFQDTSGAIGSRTSLEASALIPGERRPWVTLTLSGYEDQLRVGGVTDNLSAIISSSLGGLFLSNQVHRTSTLGGPAANAGPTLGTLLASKVFANWSLRGQADYSLAPDRRLEDLSLTADTSWLQPVALEGSVGHSPVSRDDTVSLGAEKTQGSFSLGLTAAYSTRSGCAFTFTFRLGLGHEPRERQWFTKAQGTADFGAVSAEAFVDAQGTGQRDPGDKALANLGFLVNGARQPGRTDAHGTLLLDGLTPGSETTIALDPGTLDDPLMRSVRPGFTVIPRPGHVAKLEVPVMYVSEVDGTAYLDQGGHRSALPGLRVELRDPGGKTVRSLRTAYDGFFDFTDVPAGSYRLEVSEASARRLGAAAPPPRMLLLTAEGMTRDGEDLVLPSASRDPAGSAKAGTGLATRAGTGAPQL